MKMESRKLAVLFLLGWLIILPRMLRAQYTITQKEAAEISFRSAKLIDELRDLFNVIANTQTSEVEIRDVIANSFSDNRNRLFFHPGILIENDLDPAAGIPNEIPVEKYLNDLDLLYQKSDTSSIDFQHIRVSNVRKADYLYVKVYFNSVFKNKYLATDAAYPVTNRLAEIRIDKDSSNRWQLQITRLGFFNPGDTAGDHAQEIAIGEERPPVVTGGTAAVPRVVTTDVPSLQLTPVLRAQTEAEEKYQSGYYKEALKVYTKAIRNNSRDAGLYLGRARCYEQLGESDKALKDYSATIQLDANNKKALLARARLYTAKNEYFAALTDYKLYTMLDKTDTAAFFSMYQLHMATNNQKSALDDLERIIDLDPRNKQAYYRKGLLLVAKDNAAALTQFNTCIGIDSNFADAWLLRGLVHASMQQVSEAIADFDGARRHRINSEGLKKIAAVGRSYYLRGLQHFNRFSWDSALVQFNTAILIDPDNAEYRYKRGEYYFALKRYDAAISHYTEAIALNKNYYEALYKRGLCHFNEGRYEAAISDLTLAIRANTREAIACKKLADAHFMLQQYEKAIAHYELALQTAAKISNRSLDPATLSDLYNNEGESYSSTGNHEKALLCFTNAVKADKNMHRAWFNRGNTLLQLGRTGEAETDLKKALDAQPANPLWNYALGETYRKAKNYGEAIARYNRSIIMDKKGLIAMHARYGRGNSYYQTGDFKRALPDYNASRNLVVDSEHLLRFRLELGSIYLHLHKSDSAQYMYTQVLDMDADQVMAQYGMGAALVQKKQVTRALPWFEKAFRSGEVVYSAVQNDRMIDAIKQDRQFKALVKKYF